jgi:hypothetical protein
MIVGHVGPLHGPSGSAEDLWEVVCTGAGDSMATMAECASIKPSGEIVLQNHPVARLCGDPHHQTVRCV